VNTWKPAHAYDVILAIQSLHHFVELKLLFDKIYAALQPDGYFLADDMIGRNGHQRWPEALKFVQQFWRELPDKYRYNHRSKCVDKPFPNTDYSEEGFEGIRAQDILPLLTKRFYFELFVGFGNIIDIFIDRDYGPNFAPTNDWDRSFIDEVQEIDQLEIESGRLKPTHMLAAMMKKPVSDPKFYKHLSPEFCVGRTGGDSSGKFPGRGNLLLWISSTLLSSFSKAKLGPKCVWRRSNRIWRRPKPAWKRRTRGSRTACANTKLAWMRWKSGWTDAWTP
jgi:hypothetical protein